MDRSEVIRLAREADSGFEGGPDEDGTLGDCLVGLVGLDAVERFAALVAAREREACAEAVENFDTCDPKYIALAIRARSRDGN